MIQSATVGTMESSNIDNDSDSVDTLTSSDCSSDDNSDRDGDESDDEGCETESLAFSVQSGRSTATVKSKKTKKRVQFKPGDSLVLVYIIPNREMLGLKSGSEDSDDSDDDGDDSDDEDEDDTDDDSEDEDDDDDEEEENEENKNKNKKPKPFARLMAVKQVTKHKKSEQKNVKPIREKNSKLINLSINQLMQKPPRRNNRANRKRERKERAKYNKKENNVVDNKSKQGKSKRYNNNKLNVINVDLDKNKRSRRTRPGILEIKATVQGDNKQETTASVPKLMYKNDLKPSVVNVNGALTVCQTKLLQRSTLQPMSLRVSKVDNRPSSSSYPRTHRQTNVRHVVSTGYDSLTSLLPDSYNGFRHSISTETLKHLDHEGHSPKDFIKRLDPDSMNDSSKRHYAWQVANGNISSQSLRTPSILPFWDSLKGSVPESNTVKLQ